MPRARLLKPGFFSNEALARLSFGHRLLYAGLWLLADREGRLEDRPARIKVQLFPYDALELEPLLSDLCMAGFIVRYEYDTPDGHTRAIAIPNFSKHQTPHHREAPSTIPAPPGVSLGLSTTQARPRPSVTDPVPVSVPDPVSVPVPDPVPSTKDQNRADAPKARVARLPFMAFQHDDGNSLRVLTKLAHEVYDVLGLSSIADASEALKSRAAQLKIQTTPDTFHKALESAAWQRHRKRG